MTPIEKLAQAYPYPTHLPGLPPDDGADWNQAEKLRDLAKIIPTNATVIVEVGCWLGRSTRGFAAMRPNAKVICIDTWLGSVEHHFNDNDKRFLPHLYDQFIVNCWGDRDRIIPIRADSINGMEILKRYGVQPDVLFIDAAHDYESVLKDVTTARAHFPGAKLTGDDYQWETVCGALRTFCNNAKAVVRSTPSSVWYI